MATGVLPQAPMMMPSVPSAGLPMGSSTQMLQMSVPAPSPPSTATADAQLLEFLRQRKATLPADVQQEITKREGAKVSQGLYSAADQLTRAREAYEQALLGRAQHLQAWKSFLAKAVTDWQEFARQFIQHEKDLQDRIAATKELFQQAKAALDVARQDAGGVVDLTDDYEEPLGGAGGGSSVDKVTMSIEQLTSSLAQLQSEAAALEVETIPAAKRPRVGNMDVKDEEMAAEVASARAASPFGKAGQ